jgi:hypothetical protein
MSVISVDITDSIRLEVDTDPQPDSSELCDEMTDPIILRVND